MLNRLPLHRHLQGTAEEREREREREGQNERKHQSETRAVYLIPTQGMDTHRGENEGGGRAIVVKGIRTRERACAAAAASYVTQI